MPSRLELGSLRVYYVGAGEGGTMEDAELRGKSGGQRNK